MPNMQSIRTIHLHPVCSIWANDRICFLKCLEFSIFKIPPELVCMILQPYYEWWSILLSYYDSVTHSNQICQRIGFGKWFALALKVSWLLAGRRLDCRHPLGRPAGIKHCFWDQFPQKMHHFRIIFVFESDQVQGGAQRSHWFQSMASGNVEELDLSVLGPGGEVMSSRKLGEIFHVWNLG